MLHMLRPWEDGTPRLAVISRVSRASSEESRPLMQAAGLPLVLLSILSAWMLGGPWGRLCGRGMGEPEQQLSAHVSCFARTLDQASQQEEWCHPLSYRQQFSGAYTI